MGGGWYVRTDHRSGSTLYIRIRFEFPHDGLGFVVDRVKTIMDVWMFLRICSSLRVCVRARVDVCLSACARVGCICIWLGWCLFAPVGVGIFREFEYT